MFAQKHYAGSKCSLVTARVQAGCARLNLIFIDYTLPPFFIDKGGRQQACEFLNKLSFVKSEKGYVPC